jgi:hypothetical protein
MKLNVVLGQDLSAYAEIEIEVPDNASKEEIVEKIRAFSESADFEETVFDEDWSTVCALRIVTATTPKGGSTEYILQDVPLEPSPFDAGQTLQSWLKGHGPSLQTVISEAAAHCLIDEPVMEVHRGYFKLPGAARIEVDFEVRKGATREEKDLAFLEALAQIGTLDYVAMSEKSSWVEV